MEKVDSHLHLLRIHLFLKQVFPSFLKLFKFRRNIIIDSLEEGNPRGRYCHRQSVTPNRKYILGV